MRCAPVNGGHAGDRARRYWRMGYRPRVLAALATAVAAAGAIAGAPAALAAVQVEQAPGRVLIPVASGRATLVAGVALPGGGALLAGTVEHSGRVYVAKVTSTGALDPSFGSEGIATVDARLAFEQILVQGGDGHILLVGRESAKGLLAQPLEWGYRHLPLAAVRLKPDGSIDRGYGVNGTAEAGIQGGCQCDHVAAVGEDGTLTFAGQREIVVQDPGSNQARFRWALSRLTPAGTLDPGFGSGGIALVPGEEGVGLSLEAGPGGSLVAQGQERVTEKDPEGGIREGPKNLMTRVTSAGAVDPSYNGGKPFKLPVFTLSDSYGQVPEPVGASTASDGRTVVETIVPGNREPHNERALGAGLVGYDAAGKFDESFGNRGYLNFEESELRGSLVLRAQDGSILAVHQPGRARAYAREVFRRRNSAQELAEPRVAPAVLEAERITPAGAFDLAFARPPGRATAVVFGGGAEEVLPDIHNPFGEATRALGANTFLEDEGEGGSGVLALPLAGGSLLLAGTVWLAAIPEGARRPATSLRFALAFLSPSFTLDPAAGGAAKAPSVTLASPHRIARPYAFRVRIPFSVQSSGPGLARVELFAGRALVARRVVALPDGSRRRVVVQVPLSGRRFLHSHRRARLTATVAFRDLFGQTATASLGRAP